MKKFLEDIKNEELKKILSYYYDLGGKRMRPTLFYTISKAFTTTENLAPFSLVLELIHTMSLYHDDVIDSAETRRGAPTVHKKWDIPTAIVGGDIFHGLIHNYLLKCIRNKEVNNSELALRFLSDLIMDVELKIGTGVIEEMQMASDKKIPTMEAAIKVASSKTAPLFAFSASAGAYLAAAPEESVSQLFEMGEKLGLAFQLLDDLADYFPSNKGMGNDLREDRKTPLLVMCDTINHSEVTHYRLIGSKLTDDHIVAFRVKFIDQFRYMMDWVEKLLTEATNLLDVVPENESKEQIKTIVQILFLQTETLRSKLQVH